jgi:hypothetical protein
MSMDELKQKYNKVLRIWMARGVLNAVGLTAFATTALPSALCSQGSDIAAVAPVADRLAAIRAAVSELPQNGKPVQPNGKPEQPTLRSDESPEIETAQWGNWNNGWGNWGNFWNKPWFNWINQQWGNY